MTLRVVCRSVPGAARCFYSLFLAVETFLITVRVCMSVPTRSCAMFLFYSYISDDCVPTIPSYLSTRQARSAARCFYSWQILGELLGYYDGQIWLLARLPTYSKFRKAMSGGSQILLRHIPSRIHFDPLSCMNCQRRSNLHQKIISTATTCHQSLTLRTANSKPPQNHEALRRMLSRTAPRKIQQKAMAIQATKEVQRMH